MGEMDRDGVTETPERPIKGSGTISRKLLAVMIVTVLLGASGIFVWYEYFRHWDVDDLNDAVNVINEMGPIIEGFDTDLAGRTVTVDAEVKDIRTHQTSLGQLNLIYLVGGRYVGLMQWGPIDFEVGDSIEMKVSFEWAVINGVEGVYSPQAVLGIGHLEQIQIIFQEGNWVSSEWVAELEDTQEDVIIRIIKVGEPVQLSICNCSIRAGANVGTMEYADLLGYYADTPDLDGMSDLKNTEGPNGTISFSDANDDGYLDDGDSFTLHNLARPNTACGAQTYFLRVSRIFYEDEALPYAVYQEPHVFHAYIVMTQEGVLWVTDSGMPHATASLRTVQEGVVVTIDYTSKPVSWDDIAFLFSDGMNSGNWHPNATALMSDAPAQYSCGVEDINEMSIECIVTDHAGNGLLDVDDMIEIVAVDGTHLNRTRYSTVFCICTQLSTAMFDESFLYDAIPVSECAIVNDEYSIAVTFGPVHNGTGYNYELMDIFWDEVVIDIGYDENMVEWNPDVSIMMTGVQTTWISDGIQLGNMSVLCIIEDLQGNGLVNTGDTVQILVTLGEGFSPDTDYSLSVHHIPTDSDICAVTFTG